MSENISTFRDLLEIAGAVAPRQGRGKWRCPECKRPALSANLDKGVYHCFYAGCEFQGGIGTLRRRLGIGREWLSRAEYLRLREQQQRAREASERLAQAVQQRRQELLDALHSLHRREQDAHRAGPDSEEAWEALASVYARQPRILAELLILENCRTADVVRFLTTDVQTRQWALDHVIREGGVFDADGKFREGAGAPPIEPIFASQSREKPDTGGNGEPT